MNQSNFKQTTSNSTIPSVAESLLNEVESRVCKTKDKHFSDEDLLSLHSIFGNVLQRSLDILEKYPTLTAYITTSKRTLIEIKGENNHCYRVFPKINFCPCRAFKHQVLEKKSQVTCKHVLAARLAGILGRIEEHVITPDQYLMLVKSMYELN